MSYTVQQAIHRLSWRLLECLLPQQLLNSLDLHYIKQKKKHWTRFTLKDWLIWEYLSSLHIFNSSRDLWVKRSSSRGSPLTCCVRTPKYLQWRLLCHQGNYFPQNLDVRVHERDGVEQQACNISLESSPSIQDCVQFKAETICQLTKLNMQCFNLLCTEAKHHALMSISAPKFFFFFSLNSFGQLAVTHRWIINREQNMFEDNWKRCHVIKTLLQANSKRLLLELQHGCF